MGIFFVQKYAIDVKKNIEGRPVYTQYTYTYNLYYTIHDGITSRNLEHYFFFSLYNPCR